MNSSFLEIGKIVSVSGLRGELRVEPWCDSPDFMLQFKKLFFNDGELELKVEKSRVQKSVVILKLLGYDDIDSANTLRGKVLYINRNDVKLEKGTYFIRDLIGLTVIDSADPSIIYGVLSEVSKTGANDVYHIKNGDREYLIPAIPQVIEKTDIENKIMIITPLKGLFDDED